MHDIIVFGIFIVVMLFRFFGWLAAASKRTPPTRPPAVPPVTGFPARPGAPTGTAYPTPPPRPAPLGSRPYPGQAPQAQQPPQRPAPGAARPANIADRGRPGPSTQQTRTSAQQGLRQPDAGSPISGLDADRQRMRERESSLISSEPEGLGTPLTSDPSTVSSAGAAALFNTSDDLLKAIIAREVLGPPLCARNRR